MVSTCIEKAFEKNQISTVSRNRTESPWHSNEYQKATINFTLNFETVGLFHIVKQFRDYLKIGNIHILKAIHNTTHFFLITFKTYMPCGRFI